MDLLVKLANYDIDSILQLRQASGITDILLHNCWTIQTKARLSLALNGRLHGRQDTIVTFAVTAGDALLSAPVARCQL